MSLCVTSVLLWFSMKSASPIPDSKYYTFEYDSALRKLQRAPLRASYAYICLLEPAIRRYKTSSRQLTETEFGEVGSLQYVDPDEEMKQDPQLQRQVSKLPQPKRK